MKAGRPCFARVLRLTIGAVLAIARASSAFAGPLQDPLVPTVATTSVAEAPRVAWRDDWTRVRPGEYLVTAALWSSALGSKLFTPAPRPWKGNFFLDEAVGDLLRAGSPAGRSRASDVSDALQIGLLMVPFLVDAAAVTALGDGNLDLAQQIAVLDLEALGFSTALIALTKATIGRVRPDVSACDEAGADFACRSDISKESLISGHTAAAFTSAGLLCAHHQYLELYGPGPIGGVVCGAGLLVATVTGGLRIAADRHYASDVIAGAVIGLLAGYGLPRILHYDADLMHSLDPRDGPKGQLELDLTAGLLAGPTGPRVAGGARASFRQLLPVDPVAIELEARGSILEAGGGSGLHRLGAEARLWWSGLALGAFGEAFAWQAEAAGLSGLVLGPEVGIGFFRRATSVLLLGHWGRVPSRASQALGGRLEVAWFEYLTFGFEVRAFFPDQRDDPMQLSMVAASVGGRLPF